MLDTDTPVMPRAVSLGQGTAWLGEAFRLFRKAPGRWIGIVGIWVLIGGVLHRFVPAGGLVSTFLNPVFQAGIMLGCASLAGGQGLRVEHLFEGFRGGRTGPLLLLGAFTLLLMIMLVLVGLAVTVGVVGEAGASGPGTLSRLFAALVVLALTVPLAMAVWFAPALIVLRGLPAWDAMRLSFRGCLMNLWPFLLYGVAALLMLIVASLPLLLGLLVALPVLALSAYTGYRDIFPLTGSALGGH